MARNLSNISDIVTEQTNTPGVMDPVLEAVPKDGTRLVIKNQVERGDAAGIPIYAELQDDDGDDLPQDTRLALMFETPTDDSPRVVSEPMENIRPYRTLSIRDQQNKEYIDSIKHRLKGNALEVEDVDRLYVAIESDTEIDWSNSRLEFESAAVKEV